MVTVTITIIRIVFLETAVFCSITQCWLTVGNDSFEEIPTSTFRVVQGLFGSRRLVATYSCLAYLEMKAANLRVTSVTDYQSTWRHTPKKCVLHQQC